MKQFIGVAICWVSLLVAVAGWTSQIKSTSPQPDTTTERKMQITRPVTATVFVDSVPVRFGFGSPANVAQIAERDIDVRPDGTGLPIGSGTATTGAVIFSAKCAACHGVGGIGGPNGSLVVTTSAPDAEKDKLRQSGGATRLPAGPWVIGNYWPYATTIFDYIRRAMPFNAPGSLTNDEVYALTAYLLTANKIVDEKVVLTAKTLPAVKMPAQSLFVPDDRKGGPQIH